MNPQKNDTVVGSVARITYHNEETGYVVARLQSEGEAVELITLVGTLPAIAVGERVRLTGQWQTHPKFGRQLQVHSYESLQPVHRDGILKYLASGLIKGIGPAYAEKIVQKFGLDTLKILDNNPEKLRTVAGIGAKRAADIQEAWQSQRHIREVMIFLAAHGVTTALAVRIFKTYGRQTLAVLKKNPYRLADDVFGVGFLTADKIAQKIGVAKEEPARIEAGLRFVLQQGVEKGHLFIPQEELMTTATDLLGLPEAPLQEILGALLERQELVNDSDRIYLPRFFTAESELAEALIRLQQGPVLRQDSRQTDALLHQLINAGTIPLSEKQTGAIRQCLTHKVIVITGGPGTGKTTLIRGILGLFRHLKQVVVLASPTGRASKRLTETTGQTAVTIHRLLEFEGRTKQFARNDRNPLQADVVILDEMSMVDTLLAHHLVSAVPPKARLVMVGDSDQLPSVGAGNVLHDIIDSTAIPVVQLEEIFRQGADSQIVSNAHLINSGQMLDLAPARKNEAPSVPSGQAPMLPKDDFGDLFFAQQGDPEKAVETILSLCGKRLPDRYGYRPIQDIQILAPMYRGILGVDNLNGVLQERLNPGAAAIDRGEHGFRVGDRVMQIRNNYDKSIYNGDIGHVLSIDGVQQVLVVDFGVPVTYEFSELDELVLAYAITVHKSQGSEFKVVILPLVTQHYMMLQRNLLYTAVTRAKELMILIGSKKALAMAIKNDYVQRRNTRLAQRLQDLRTI